MSGARGALVDFHTANDVFARISSMAAVDHASAASVKRSGRRSNVGGHDMMVGKSSTAGVAMTASARRPMPSVATAGVAMDAAARSVAAILKAKPRAIFFFA